MKAGDPNWIAFGSICSNIGIWSKSQIPHFYLDIEIDAGPLLELRVQLNDALEKEGVKLSVNDFVLKASAEALRRVPAVNCSWEGTAVRQHPAAHVSFAVAIDDGLITPVIRDAHVKTIFAISAEAKALGKRAKDKKLAPAAITRGRRVSTTTISREQFDHACARVRAAGVEDLVTVLCEDYRDLRGSYDKLVSIEMIEAVGYRDFGTFFGRRLGPRWADAAPRRS